MAMSNRVKLFIPIGFFFLMVGLLSWGLFQNPSSVQSVLVNRPLPAFSQPGLFLAALVDWARGPYPGARSLLGQIPDRYRLVCLSNSNELHTPLHRRSMEPLFDRYYFSDEIGLVKPEGEIFEYVVSDLGVPPNRIVFFDDTPINVEGARRAGMSAFQTDGIDELEARLRALGILSPARAP